MFFLHFWNDNVDKMSVVKLQKKTPDKTLALLGHAFLNTSFMLMFFFFDKKRGHIHGRISLYTHFLTGYQIN